ncbi:MAG: dethiobiotin synthase [Lysinibacillus sp.]
MQNFWVVGTDTDVGKTFVTTVLLRDLQQRGVHVTPYKPVQTGEIVEGDLTYYYDTTMYEKFTKQQLTKGSLNSYSFKEAASPHYAAQLEGIVIDHNLLLHHIELLQNEYDVVICEGAGGLYVPLDASSRSTLLDLIVQSGLPVVLVTRTSLGTINHTMLSLEALKVRGVHVLGLVFNRFEGTEVELNNIETILAHSGLHSAILPKVQGTEQLVTLSVENSSLFERLVKT